MENTEGRPAVIERVFGEGGSIVTISGYYRDRATERTEPLVIHWDHRMWRHFVEANRDLTLPFLCEVRENDAGALSISID